MKILAKKFTHLASIIYRIPPVFNYFLSLTADLNQPNSSLAAGKIVRKSVRKGRRSSYRFPRWHFLMR